MFGNTTIMVTYCRGDGKVTFTRPFLTLGKVTFDEHANVLQRYCKGDIYYTFTKQMALFPKSRSLKVYFLLYPN